MKPASFTQLVAGFLILSLIIMTGIFDVSIARAAINKEINYQGKLFDSAGDPVADGTYEMEFKLYTAASGGVAIWTETLDGADEVEITDGLFSVLLGAVSSLSAIDFNQTLYLGVNIENDGEMTPRKKIGAVPAAFVADTIDGLDSTQFLRSDTTNASGIFTALTATNATITNASTTNITVAGKFYDSAGSGGINGQVLKISGGVPVWGTDNSGGGGSEVNWTYFNGSGIYVSTTTNQVLIGDVATTSNQALEVIGGAYFSGNLGLGTTSPYAKLSVDGRGVFNQDVRANYFTATSTSVASVFPYASSTAITVSGTASTTNLIVSNTANLAAATIGSLNGLLNGTNGSVGTIATSTLNIALSDTTGTLAVNRGGTGLTSYTPGDVLYASGATTLAGTSTANLKTTLGLNNVENTALSTWAGSTNLTTLGTIATGIWNGTIIGDAYITKTGAWTGTFDGQEGSYYLDARNQTNFGTPFYQFFSATTTSALAEGLNLYWTNDRFDARLAATTTLPNLTTLLGLTDTITTRATTTQATTTNLYVSGTGGLRVGSLTGPLQAVNGVVSASSTLSVAYGGTGTSTAPSYGRLLVGNSLGEYDYVATSSLGLATFGYLFPSNATSTLLSFTGGLTSYASTTIGNGTAAGGLTVSGNATTTGTLKVLGTASTSNLIVSNSAYFNSLANGGVAVNSSGQLYSYATSTWTFASSTLLADNNTFSGTNIFGGGTTFNGAGSFTAGLTANALTIGSLTGPLQAVAGVVSASSTLSIAYGGTGTSTAPSYGRVLVGNSLGGYDLVATSSLGITGTGSSFSYLFPSNATSTLLSFTGGLTSYASTTIGGGTQATGLTISGGATTTGNVVAQSGFRLSSLNCDPYLNDGKLTTDALGNVICADDISSAGGGSGGTWSTTTSSVTGQYVNYSNSNVSTDIIAVGGSATTTAKFWFDPAINYASLASGDLILDGTNVYTGTGVNFGVGTSSPFAKLSVAGIGSFDDYVRASYFIATSTATSTFAGSIAVTEANATSTFAGGIDLSDGCFAVDGVCLGGSNYGDTNVNAYIHASTTIPKTYTDNTFTGTNIFSALTIGSLTGPLQAVNGVVSASSTLSIAYGGTGTSTAPSYGRLLVGNSLGGYDYVATSSLGITSSQWTTNGSNIYYNSGNVSIGTTTSPSNAFTVLSTTQPQMRLAYDTSNYFTSSVNSTGGAAFSFNGASSSLMLNFAQPAITSGGTGLDATTSLSVLGATGGNSSNADNAFSGAGGGITLTGGTGGIPTQNGVNDFKRGGSGGAVTIRSGAGGSSTVTNTGSGINTGGTGGTLSLIAGIGGNASSGSGNQGGTGGSLVLLAGDGGNGSTAGNGGSTFIAGGMGGSAGTAGNVYLGATSTSVALGNVYFGTQQGIFNTTTGFMGLGTTSPYAKLSVWNSGSGRSFEVVNSASTTNLWVSATGFGTTTVTGLNISGSATSTSNVGFNLSGGCYAVGGVCLSSGTSYTDANTNAYIHASSTIPKTYTDNTFTGANIFGGITTFNGAGSFTAGLTANTLTIGSLTGPLQAVNGVVSASSTLSIAYGGTGTSTAPSYGRLLLGNSLGGYDLVATSSLGLGSGTGTVNEGTLNRLSYYTGATAVSSADFLSIDASNSYLGIGTSTPYSKLSVWGAGTGTNRLFELTNSASTTLASVLENGTAYFLGNVGIGTTSPYAKLSVAGQIVGEYFTATSTTATSTFAGSVNIGNGAIVHDAFTGTTSISYLEAGNMNFAADSGVISWIDMPVTSASANGVVNSYSANINGNSLLTIYGVSNGSGSVTNTAVGIGTTSPAWKLSVAGNGSFDDYVRASYFVATSSTASVFPYASSTALTVSGTASTSNLIVSNTANLAAATIGSLNGLLYGTNGSVGTIATSSLGLATFGYLFPSNATSTLLSFNGGLTSYASTTIGGGTQTTGLTIFGGATTTGNAYFAGNVGIGTTSPYAALSIHAGATSVYNPTLFAVGSSTAAYATSTLFNVLANGNVGVGTSSPFASLAIQGKVLGYGSNLDPVLAVYGGGGSVYGQGIILQAGEGQTAGGDVKIYGGNFSTSDGNGGAVRIGAGQGGAQGVAGNTYIDGGVGNSGTNGNILLSTVVSGNVGIGTTSPYAKLSVVGQVVGAYFTATTSTASTFPYASSTAITVSGTASTTNLIVSNTASIGTLSGLLLGTSGVVSSVATSTLNIALSDTTGTLAVNRGGTGQTSFGQGWLGINDSGAFISSTSPTVNYITATSTATSTFAGSIAVTEANATSTFAGGIDLSDGCFAVDGVCLGGSSYSDTNVNAYIHASTTIPKTYTDNTFTGTNIFGGTATFNGAGSFTAGLTANALTIGSLNGPLQAVGGLVSASSTLSVAYGGTGWSSLASGYVPFGNGASALATSSSFFWDNTNSRLGIGTSSPYAKLSVAGQIVGEYFTATSTTATSTFAGGLDVGAGNLTYDLSTGITSASAFQTGNLNFDTDAGLVSWTDLTLSSAPSGTPQGYTAFLNGSSTISVYGVSAGSGWLQDTYPRVSIGATSAGTSTPSSRLTVFGSGTGTGGLFELIDSASTSRMKVLDNGNIGIGSTSPSWLLSVAGIGSFDNYVRASYFVATSSTASILPYASTTALTVSGTNGLQLATGLNGPLQAVGGLVSASSTLSVAYGGTGWSSLASGYVPFGNGASALATSSSFFWDNANSRLGIGTSSPYAKLSVAGQIVGEYFTATSTTATSTFAGDLYVGSGTGDSILQLGDDTNAWTAGYLASDKTFRIASSTGLASNVALAIAKGGNVGIGSTTPWRTLSVTGTVALNGLTSSATGNAVCITTNKDITDAGGGTCTPSSERFKENIVTLAPGTALDQLSQMRVVSFDYKDGYYSTEEASTSVGLIAEELETINPVLVDYGYDGKPLTIHFERLTGLTIQAIQEQQNQIGNIASTTLILDSKNKELSDLLVTNLASSSQSNKDLAKALDLTNTSIISLGSQFDLITADLASTSGSLSVLTANLSNLDGRVQSLESILGNLSASSTFIAQIASSTALVLASTTAETLATSEPFMQRIFDGFMGMLATATTQIRGVFVKELHVEDKLCVDDVCINKDQLKALLVQAGGTSASSTAAVVPPAAPTPTPTPVVPPPSSTPAPLVPVVEPVSPEASSTPQVTEPVSGTAASSTPATGGGGSVSEPAPVSEPTPTSSTPAEESQPTETPSEPTPDQVEQPAPAPEPTPAPEPAPEPAPAPAPEPAPSAPTETVATES